MHNKQFKLFAEGEIFYETRMRDHVERERFILAQLENPQISRRRRHFMEVSADWACPDHRPHLIYAADGNC